MSRAITIVFVFIIAILALVGAWQSCEPLPPNPAAPQYEDTSGQYDNTTPAEETTQGELPVFVERTERELPKTGGE